MADLFDGYPLGEVWDEMFGEPGRARPAYAGLFASLQPIDGEELAARADLLTQTYRDAGVTFAHAGEERPFPLDIVPRVIGADEWDGHRARRRAAGARAGGVPRRRLRRRPGASPTGSCRAASSPPARTSTAQAHGHRAAERRPRARLGHRPGPRRGRRLPGARGQRARRRRASATSSRTARAMSQVLPELFADHRVRPVADYPSRLLAALQAVRAGGRRRPDRRRAHPRRLQLRLLRARAAGPADGRRAGRGPRPGLRAATGSACGRRDGEQRGRRHLPPDRRRVPRPGALPARLGARLRRRAQRRARRPGDHRQRRRQRRRRRQAALHLRARPDPLLPGRGADPAERRHLPARRRRTPSSGCSSRLDELVLKPVDGSGGKGIVIGPQARRADADRARGQGARATRGAGSRSSRSALSTVPDPGRRPDRARGTSTCARSRSTTATRCGCCPAG